MSKKENKSGTRSIVNGPTMGYTDISPKRATWKDIADKLNGEFKIKSNSGHELEIHELSIPYQKWNIGISVSDSRPLKFNILFNISQDFDMVISRKGFIEKILKKLGKREVELGWKEFDNHYLIESSKPHLVKRVLTKEIQKTLLKFNVYSLSFLTDSKNRTATLISVIQRDGGDEKMILELIEMFKTLIDNLKKSRVI